MNSYYVLTFGNEKDEHIRLRIKDADENPNPFAVPRAMDTLILANALDPKHGTLTTKIKAELYKIETEPLNVE